MIGGRVPQPHGGLPAHSIPQDPSQCWARAPDSIARLTDPSGGLPEQEQEQEEGADTFTPRPPHLDALQEDTLPAAGSWLRLQSPSAPPLLTGQGCDGILVSSLCPGTSLLVTHSHRSAAPACLFPIFRVKGSRRWECRVRGRDRKRTLFSENTSMVSQHCCHPPVKAPPLLGL